MKFKYMVVVVFLFGFLTQAHSAPSIVVTSSKREGAGVRYYYTLSGWSINDTARTFCGDPDYGTGCIITEKIFFDSVPASYSNTNGWRINLTPGYVMTMGMILLQLNNRGEFYMPLNTSVLVEGYSYNATCVVLYLGTSSTSQPLTNCAPVKSPPVNCNLTGNDTINHNTLSDNALNGAQASTTLYIRCAGSTSLTVKANRTNSYGVRLRSDDSLYSDVNVNGKDASDGIDVAVTNNMNTPINISSTLKTRGAVAPGPFSGSTVITVSPN